jgi:hypothetical protein
MTAPGPRHALPLSRQFASLCSHPEDAGSRTMTVESVMVRLTRDP